jgi:DNA-binding GntR family transcriptional regulator
MSRSSPQQGQQLLSELRRRIVLNELAPGSVLTELGIAAELGRSQSAVREALLRLEGEGLVRRAGRQGTTVTDLDSDTASEILDLRRRIELRGARRAVKRAVAGDVAGLQALLEAMHLSAAAGDVWGVVEQDIAFHLALFRIAGLDALEPILERCILHTHRFKLWAPWHQRPLRETAARHGPLIEALAEGDAARLARDLGEHIDTIVERRSAA